MGIGDTAVTIEKLSEKIEDVVHISKESLSSTRGMCDDMDKMSFELGGKMHDMGFWWKAVHADIQHSINVTNDIQNRCQQIQEQNSKILQELIKLKNENSILTHKNSGLSYDNAELKNHVSFQTAFYTTSVILLLILVALGIRLIQINSMKLSGTKNKPKI